MPDSYDDIPHPKSRVQILSEYGKVVQVNNNIPAKTFVRSGPEMIRMAKIYQDEGQLENAFILFNKYITLFVEKLPKHVEYSQISAAERSHIKLMLKTEIFPRAEKIKELLLARYTKEYTRLVEEQEKRKKEQETLMKEKIKEEELRKRIEKEKLAYEQEKAFNLALETERSRLKDEPSAPPLVDVNHFYSESIHNESLKNQKDDPRLEEPNKVSNNIPVVDRSTKPSFLLSPAQSDKETLRTIILPTGTMQNFLQLAESNTRRDIETCGILAGTMANSEFKVTHLIIPKQKGTPNSCSADNEEDIFNYQDKHELITLGWIHTHPTQTAFMSSIDLHTHFPYQLMVPEAIAVVCAPKYNETGIFMLTVDYGLNYIASCQGVGFHAHPDHPPLYTECSHIKHVNSDVVVSDLRT